MSIQIPTNELRLSFARSSGAGGQNVNKTSTKVTLHWNVNRSRVLNWPEKALIMKKLANKINVFGEVVVSAESERSQLQNRNAAISRLNILVNKALRMPKKRRPTRPTLGSKLRKQAGKTLRSQLKMLRRTVE
jgi:ribosome-associated protein